MDWSGELVKDIARRRCVIVAGSGVSAHSTNASSARPKTWAGLTDVLLEGVPNSKYIKSLKKQFDYLTLCELAEKRHGRADIGNKLRDEYVVPAFRPAIIHEHLFNLDSRIVATPNFDKIYETYAGHRADGTIAVKTYYDSDVAEAVRGSGRLILKIHGTIDAPARCILTRHDYAKARSEHRSFYDLFFGLFITHSLLFLGCGFSDPDIRLLLEDSKFRFIHNAPHYFVVPSEECSGDYKAVLESSLNIKIINFRRRNDYKELVDGLGELVTLVEAQRDKLKVDGNW